MLVLRNMNFQEKLGEELRGPIHINTHKAYFSVLISLEKWQIKTSLCDVRLNLSMFQ